VTLLFSVFKIVDYSQTITDLKSRLAGLGLVINNLEQKVKLYEYNAYAAAKAIETKAVEDVKKVEGIVVADAEKVAAAAEKVL
jgi:hypothetical protein